MTVIFGRHKCTTPWLDANVRKMLNDLTQLFCGNYARIQKVFDWSESGYYKNRSIFFKSGIFNVKLIKFDFLDFLKKLILNYFRTMDQGRIQGFFLGQPPHSMRKFLQFARVFWGKNPNPPLNFPFFTKKFKIKTPSGVQERKPEIFREGVSNFFVQTKFFGGVLDFFSQKKTQQIEEIFHRGGGGEGGWLKN